MKLLIIVSCVVKRPENRFFRGNGFACPELLRYNKYNTYLEATALYTKALLTDLYQLTMMQGLFLKESTDKPVPLTDITERIHFTAATPS